MSGGIDWLGLAKEGVTVPWIGIVKPVPFHSAEAARRVERVIHHPVTPEEQAAYEAAKAAYDMLLEYPGFYVGESELDEPTGRVEVIYAETEDEWRVRVRSLPPVYIPKGQQ